MTIVERSSRWPGANSTVTLLPPTVMAAGAKVVLLASVCVAIARFKTRCDKREGQSQSRSPPPNPKSALLKRRGPMLPILAISCSALSGAVWTSNLKRNQSSGADRPRALKLSRRAQIGLSRVNIRRCYHISTEWDEKHDYGKHSASVANSIVLLTSSAGAGADLLDSRRSLGDWGACYSPIAFFG
jgi:hypothetical protein